MGKFDRSRQLFILERAKAEYPASASMLDPLRNEPIQGSWADIQYLAEHGLLRVDGKKYMEGTWAHLNVFITAKGIDFLADDGGLSAILGVVTVKLHEDTLKELIAAKIQGSDLPAPDKKRFLDQLRELPGETTKHLVLKLVDAGLQNWPQALQLLQSALPG